MSFDARVGVVETDRAGTAEEAFVALKAPDVRAYSHAAAYIGSLFVGRPHFLPVITIRGSDVRGTADNPFLRATRR